MTSILSKVFDSAESGNDDESGGTETIPVVDFSPENDAHLADAGDPHGLTGGDMIPALTVTDNGGNPGDSLSPVGPDDHITL